MGLQRLLGIKNPLALSRAYTVPAFGLYFALQQRSVSLTGSWLSAAFGKNPNRVIFWSHLRKAYPLPG